MYPFYDIPTIYDLSYIQRDNQLTRELYRQLSNKEEETVTKFKVGDKVVPTESTFGLTGKVGTIEKRGFAYDWSVVFGNKVIEPFDEGYLVHFEEEKEMTEKKKFFKGQSLIRNNGSEVEFLLDDGGDVIPILISHGDNTDWVSREELEPSDKFTFAQVVQGLLEGYFEEGTEFRANGRSVFVDCNWTGNSGLVDDLGGGFLRMEIGLSLIHSTWELVPKEEPIKELTLNELEEILGHKVKIKNND